MLIVFGIVLAGWVGLFALRPRPSVCPACGCLMLMPNRSGTRFQCQNCHEVFYLYMGQFVGRPGVRIAPALPAASIRETKPKE
jgi:hypothetical protein